MFINTSLQFVVSFVGELREIIEVLVDKRDRTQPIPQSLSKRLHHATAASRQGCLQRRNSLGSSTPSPPPPPPPHTHTPRKTALEA